MTSRQNIKLDLLQQFRPFDTQDKELLRLLSKDIELLQAEAGEELFTSGDTDSHDFFLTEGTVSLTAEDGRTNLIEAGSEASKVPLAALRPRKYLARAATAISYFMVDTSVLETLRQIERQQQASGNIDDIKRKAHAESKALFYEFRQELINGRFTLPTLPEVATRIRQEIDQQQSDAQSIARIVNTDPAIAAKLVKAANSAFYRGINHCDNTLAAITRLGLVTTKQLVTSFALHGVLQTDSRLVRDRMTQIWRNSLLVASCAYTLAKSLGHFDQEEALLAGLIHSVGEIAAIAYIDRYYQDDISDNQLAFTIRSLRGEVGALIMQEWDFNEAMTTVARESDKWLRTGKAAADYCDLVLVAKLHVLMAGMPSTRQPARYSAPAYRKLCGLGLTPDISAQVIQAISDTSLELENIIAN